MCAVAAVVSVDVAVDVLRCPPLLDFLASGLYEIPQCPVPPSLPTLSLFLSHLIAVPLQASSWRLHVNVGPHIHFMELKLDISTPYIVDETCSCNRALYDLSVQVRRICCLREFSHLQNIAFSFLPPR